MQPQNIGTEQLGITPDNLLSGNFPQDRHPDIFQRVGWLFVQLDYYKLNGGETNELDYNITIFKFVDNILRNISPLLEEKLEKKELGGFLDNVSKLVVEITREINYWVHVRRLRQKNDPIHLMIYVISPKCIQNISDYEMLVRNISYKVTK